MLPSLGNLKPSYVSSLQLLAAGIFICQIELTGGRVLQCLTCGQTFCTDSFGGTQINIRMQAALAQTHFNQYLAFKYKQTETSPLQDIE
jgi:polyferredoxin